MTTSLVRLLRFASIAICTIVALSFLVFAIDQTGTASGRQQEQLAGASAPPATHAAKNESDLHRTLDEASSQLTSPFAGIVSASSGEWASRGVKLLAALLVYGFGLGYLARAIRVRV